MSDDTQNPAQPLPPLNVKALEVDPEVQKMLNQPLEAPEVSEADKSFLQLILDKVEKGEIQLFVASSLINKTVYDGLTQEGQAQADLNAFNFLAEIRNIKNLHDANMAGTYEMQYMIRHLRVIKERMEALGGDIFII